MEFDEFGDEGLLDSIFDVKYCNDATLDYDIEKDLNKIRSKSFNNWNKSGPVFPSKFRCNSNA